VEYLEGSGIWSATRYPFGEIKASEKIFHGLAAEPGLWVLENLALACIDCNLQKGPNLSGIDPETRKVTELFIPDGAPLIVSSCF
jgi:5-methylcytosine-specific restriction endonuclease McrA